MSSTTTAGLQERNRILEKNRERFRTLVESASDLVTELDAEGRFVYASPSFRDRLGYAPEDILGRHPFEFVHLEDQPMVGAALAKLIDQDTTQVATCRFRHSDGAWLWFESTGNVARSVDGERRLVVISRDITERRRLDEQMREAQKLESLGVLAGGIAHDFNNLLVGIQGNAEMALLELEADSPARELIVNIEAAGELAAGLTQQLLAYAGRGGSSFRKFDLTGLVTDMASLLRSAVSRRVDLDIETLDSPCWVNGDRDEVRRVILNLVTNAAESMGEAGGEVAVRRGHRSVDRAFLQGFRIGREVDEGDYVFIEIQDEGGGMDEEAMDRIFDPFFSTKAAGSGLPP